MQNRLYSFEGNQARYFYNQSCMCIQRFVSVETPFPHVWRKDVTAIGTFFVFAA